METLNRTRAISRLKTARHQLRSFIETLEANPNLSIERLPELPSLIFLDLSDTEYVGNSSGIFLNWIEEVINESLAELMTESVE